ncbi:MAG: hypothetical protein LH606_00165 [Cytophagaceae bacterium]|nr:hypothetical protein [Cytophagaceae bacterium]
MSSEEFFRHVSTATILLPVGVSLLRWRAMVAGFPTLLAYLWLTLLIESWGTFTLLQGTTNNGFVYNFYNVAEFVLLSLLYYRYFDHPELKRLVLVLNGLFVPYALYRFLRMSGGYDGTVLGLENALLILLVLLFFYQLLQNLEITHLSRFPMFWISAGVLVFFAGSFFIYVFGSYLVSPEKYATLRDLWNIPRYLNIVFHLALATGIWYSE